ncbi:RraA family protein [Microbacterium saperdae]|uniref:Putative 4-hydroxy-4-methyl-2-oxoglutarate aldolase n=1 Tax=Microbacterium saperdae TaxID=69368 RepID=A0A543B9V0_9MICO|nr:RraA family protein [Microbacterium saperdae]TQL81617.1 regulator of RNase E activity RraA [Microbacterium saperdae]GGM33448.1 demethylmenaquinone methyltransferase [Microbacterium saperdae]
MQDTWSIEEINATLFTAVLSDIMDGLGLGGQVADPSLRPLQAGMRVVGYARPCRAVSVNREPEAPYAALMQIIDDLQDQDVLLIAMDQHATSAIFGGLLATAVSSAGGRGVIVDGFARDADEIVEIGMPTFVKGLVPLDSYGRDEVVEIDQPITIAGVPAGRGDLVFGDEDGLVVVPHARLGEVLRLAFEKVAGESDVRAALKGGMSTSEAFAKFGIL